MLQTQDAVQLFTELWKREEWNYEKTNDSVTPKLLLFIVGPPLYEKRKTILKLSNLILHWVAMRLMDEVNVAGYRGLWQKGQRSFNTHVLWVRDSMKWNLWSCSENASIYGGNSWFRTTDWTEKCIIQAEWTWRWIISQNIIQEYYTSYKLSGELHSTKPIGRNSHLKHCTKIILLNISTSFISQLKTPAWKCFGFGKKLLTLQSS